MLLALPKVAGLLLAAICATQAALSTGARLNASSHHARHGNCSMTYAYLVQGDTFREDARLVSTRCRHVYWLTFKQPSPDPNHLYMPGSTFTNGRNALLEQAMAAAIPYDYFVILDVDALRMANVHGGSAADNPWHLFEAHLAEWRPAVGYMTRYSGHAVDEGRPVTTGQADVDANVNAFHTSTVGVLIPYDATFESESWYFSLLIQGFLVAAFYPDYRVGFNDLALADAANEHSYDMNVHSLDWTVGKRYLSTLLLPGTDSYTSMARAMCFATHTTELCNWKTCPRTGPPSHALNCAWVDRAVNASHPLGARIRQTCVESGMVPDASVFYRQCD